MQFTALATLAFADIPQDRMAPANTWFSVAFQLGNGLGVAHRRAGCCRSSPPPWLHTPPTLAAFHLPPSPPSLVLMLAALPPVALCGCQPDAGAAVSGHHRLRPDVARRPASPPPHGSSSGVLTL